MNRNISLLSIMVSLLIGARLGEAGVHFTLTGKLSDSSYGLLSQANHAASASIAFDVGQHLRLGLTHRQDKSVSEGYYKIDLDSDLYEFRRSTSLEIANSVELTIILYYGRVFIPYLQIGLVKKDYIFTQGDVTRSVSLPPIPNGGFGLGVRLNRNFSLKLSQTFSQAVTIPYPEAEPEPTLDTYSSVGITYSL